MSALRGFGHERAARVALLLASSALVAPHAASAADWTGATSINWSTPANWSTGAVPTITEDVIVNTTVNAPVVMGSPATTYYANSLLVGNTADAVLFVQDGNTLNVNANGTTLEFSAGVTGQITVTDLGTQFLSVGTASGGSLDVGALGNGNFFVLKGAQAGTSYDLVLGRGASSSSAAQGTVQVDGSGSLLQSGASIVAGRYGTGTLSITNGGLVSSVSAVLGQYSGSTGSVTVDGPGSQWNVSGVSGFRVGQEGTGTLTIRNGGSVSTNSNGGVDIGYDVTSNGTVLVTGAGSGLASAGDVAVGALGRGTLTVSDGGMVTVAAGGTLHLAQIAGSTGTLNIGAAGTDPAAAPGTLNAVDLVFGAGTGALTFNHTSTNYDFSTRISGGGASSRIYQMGGTTILSGNDAGFAGTTDVYGGTLKVNGTLGGTVLVNGGTLGGSGTITGSVIAYSGMVSPGNSIGTLNVTNATFNAGSTYLVELKAGGNTPGVHNDLLNASGTVTINGGTVRVTPENGTDTGSSYTPNTTYTIITAAGGRTGTFTSLTDDYPFLNFALSYDANNVYLTSALAPTDFCLAGMSSNECAAARGVQSLGAGSLYTAVLNLASAAAPGAMDQLSGEIHASVRTALIEDSRFAREAALNRLRNTSAGIAATGTGMVEQRLAELTLWGQGFGAWGDWDRNSNAAGVDRSIAGLFLGGDALVTDAVRLGLMGGYSRSNFDIDARLSSGTADTWTVGAYGGGQWGALNLRLGGAHGWSDIDTKRFVSFTGFSDSLTASHNARLGQVYGEAAYRFDAGRTNFEPFANLAYVNLHTAGFIESGGAAALSASDQTTGTTFTTLGLRADASAALGQTAGVRLIGMAGWRYAFGDVTPRSALSFAAGGNAFVIAGVPVAKDALVLDLGMDLNLTPNATLGMSYGGQFGSGFIDQSFRANLAMKF